MSAKFDYKGHTMEITNVQGKPGFYSFQVDGRSSKVVLNVSEMIDRVRHAKAKLRSDKIETLC